MVGRIQDHLQALYGIRCEARVNDYLIDEEAAQKLGWTGRSREELLVLEEDGGIEVALFLDRALLERFGGDSEVSLGLSVERDLESYCQIAEGVSHFLYLAHAAQHSRTVSLLELETQAEIDKFASCVVLRWSDGPIWAERLLEQLFDRVSYLPSLSEEERWRYVEANRLSRSYCQRLIAHVKARNVERFLQDLRYSYRLGAQAKVRHLLQTA